MKRLILIFLLIPLLAACGDDSDDDETVNNPGTPTPSFLLRADSLPLSLGGWTMVDGTLNLVEREAAIILSADYTSTASPAVAKLNLSLYRDAGEARTVFNDRLAALQSDSTIRLEEVSTLADEAYTVNGNQGGLALVDIYGVLILEFQGEVTHSEFDTLNLMQIGVNALRVRAERSQGGLGSKPILVEEPTQQP